MFLFCISRGKKWTTLVAINLIFFKIFLNLTINLTIVKPKLNFRVMMEGLPSGHGGSGDSGDHGGAGSLGGHGGSGDSGGHGGSGDSGRHGGSGIQEAMVEPPPRPRPQPSPRPLRQEP